MKRVEIFEETTLYDLELLINSFCESENLEPQSVSITIDGDGSYIAAVVVKELE